LVHYMDIYVCIIKIKVVNLLFNNYNTIHKILQLIKIKYH
jgi:hypothetical protein